MQGQKQAGLHSQSMIDKGAIKAAKLTKTDLCSYRKSVDMDKTVEVTVCHE